MQAGDTGDTGGAAAAGGRSARNEIASFRFHPYPYKQTKDELEKRKAWLQEDTRVRERTVTECEKGIEAQREKQQNLRKGLFDPDDAQTKLNIKRCEEMYKAWDTAAKGQQPKGGSTQEVRNSCRRLWDKVQEAKREMREKLGETLTAATERYLTEKNQNPKAAEWMMASLVEQAHTTTKTKTEQILLHHATEMQRVEEQLKELNSAAERKAQKTQEIQRQKDEVAEQIAALQRKQEALDQQALDLDRDREDLDAEEEAKAAPEATPEAAPGAAPGAGGAEASKEAEEEVSESQEESAQRVDAAFKALDGKTAEAEDVLLINDLMCGAFSVLTSDKGPCKGLVTGIDIEAEQIREFMDYLPWTPDDLEEIVQFALEYWKKVQFGTITVEQHHMKFHGRWPNSSKDTSHFIRANTVEKVLEGKNNIFVEGTMKRTPTQQKGRDPTVLDPTLGEKYGHASVQAYVKLVVPNAPKHKELPTCPPPITKLCELVAAELHEEEHKCGPDCTKPIHRLLGQVFTVTTQGKFPRIPNLNPRHDTLPQVLTGPAFFALLNALTYPETLEAKNAGQDLQESIAMRLPIARKRYGRLVQWLQNPEVIKALDLQVYEDEEARSAAFKGLKHLRESKRAMPNLGKVFGHNQRKNGNSRKDEESNSD